jgi:hypothetical protein
MSEVFRCALREFNCFTALGENNKKLSEQKYGLRRLAMVEGMTHRAF